MVTIHEVAKLAGVSIGTVSNVINQTNKVSPRTSEKVMAAIKELNYIPNPLAKSLKTNQSRIIGVMAEDVRGFSSPDIIDGVCDFFETENYSISLANLRVNTKAGREFLYKEVEESDVFKKSINDALSMLLASRICGLIYIGTHLRDVGNILPGLDIPVVYTFAYTMKKDYCVNYDDYQGARLATEYLIKMGHKRIAVICGAINSVPTHKRLMGYQTALMEHNLPLYPEYIRTADWHYEGGYEQCLELLRQKNPPTAIFSMSDLMALGAINAATDNKLRVPEDISIHGFDNLELIEFIKPALTTVRIPLHDLGFQTARLLSDILHNHKPEKHSLLLPCTHVVRDTVRFPGKSKTPLQATGHQACNAAEQRGI